MFSSFAIIMITALLAGELFRRLRLPALMGMIISGIIIGPYVLNLIDTYVLEISAELRKIALIIILMRAGLSLYTEKLRKIGRPAIMMCFVPACFEILGMVLHFHIRDTVKIILIMSVSFVFTVFEDKYGSVIPFSAMIGVMCSGLSIKKVNPKLSERLSLRFSKLWVLFEILLFVLVGTCINIRYAAKAGSFAVILIFAVLAFRMSSVAVCLIKTGLVFKERLFCMLAYMPKATVQAAIGGIPLAIGLSCGEVLLTVAVLSIIITAPLGAFLIDMTYKKLLNKQSDLG